MREGGESHRNPGRKDTQRKAVRTFTNICQEKGRHRYTTEAAAPVKQKAMMIGGSRHGSSSTDDSNRALIALR